MLLMPEPQHHKIGVLLHPDYDRPLIHEVIEYARPYRNWTVRHAWPKLDGVQHLAQWGAEGIIGPMNDPEVLEAVRQSGLPAVNTHDGIEPMDVPSVMSDSTMIGQLAANYLYQLNCRHYVFAAFKMNFGASLRRRGFHEGLGELGASLAYSEIVDIPWREIARSQAAGRKLVEESLQPLPKPIGMFCFNDELAFYLHGACRDSGLKVGRDVHLLGVDNDTTYCLAAPPAFSSIDRGRIGAHAAECLEKQLHGQSVPRVTWVPPRELLARDVDESAQVMPPEVTAAIRYIENHLGSALQVDNVLNQVPVSRRTLQILFKKSTGHTIRDEINQQRIERACKLLGTTRWSIHRIAHASGFTDSTQFGRAFRHSVGQTPSNYRQSNPSQAKLDFD